MNLLEIFAPQLEAANPLTQEMVNAMVKARLSFGMSEQAALASLPGGVGEKVVYYMIRSSTREEVNVRSTGSAALEAGDFDPNLVYVGSTKQEGDGVGRIGLPIFEVKVVDDAQVA